MQTETTLRQQIAELQDQLDSRSKALTQAEAQIRLLEARQVCLRQQNGAEKFPELCVLSHVVNRTPASIIVTDAEGEIQYVNPYFTKLTGYTLSESLGNTPRMLKSGLNPPHVYADLWATITSGQQWEGELHNCKKDGSLYWEYARIAPVQDDSGGNITHFIAVKEDITAFKQNVRHLRESEAFVHATLNALSAQIAILDAEGTIIAVNTAWHAVTDNTQAVPAKTDVGVNYLDVLRGVDPLSEDAVTAQTIMRGMNAVITGERDSFSLEYPCRNGQETRWYIVRVTHFRTGEDNAIRVVVAHEDITERVMAEKMLADSNKRLEATVKTRTKQLQRVNRRLNNVSTPILLVNAEGQIDTTNPAFDRRMGYESQALLGHSLWDIFDDDSQPALMKLWRTVHTSEIPRSPIEACLTTKDGATFEAEVSLSLLPENAGHVVCTLYDISHLKEVERLKDQFISVASHDLRTPVSAILLSASTIQHYYDRLSDERKREKVAQISEQAERLKELMTAILDVSRFDARHGRRGDTIFDTGQVLEIVANELKEQAALKGQQIEVEINGGGTHIIGEKSDITRVWQNLLSNAIKYTGTNGQIKVKLFGANETANPHHSPELGDFAAHLPDDIQSGQYMIGVISDTGHGIPEEDLPHLFTRFYRGWAAESDIKGTGLGLALTRDLLQLYEGDIAVSSKEANGATFCFWLPAHTAESET